MPAIVGICVTIAIVGIIALGAGVYLVKRQKARRGTSTIVKAVPVTTIANPEATSASANSNAVNVEMEGESKI